MSAENRAFGASLLLAVDGLFLGALLYIHWHVSHAASPWPDAGGPGGANLALAAAVAVILAAVLCRPRVPPIAPFFSVSAAILLAALALRAADRADVWFGVGRYGTLLHMLTWTWIVHLLGAAIALGSSAARRQPPGINRFVALQALFGVVLAWRVFAW